MKKESLFFIALLLCVSNLVVSMQRKAVVTWVDDAMVTTTGAKDPYLNYLSRCTEIKFQQEQMLQSLIQKSSSSSYENDIELSQAALRKASCKVRFLRRGCMSDIQASLDISQEKWKHLLVFFSKLKNLENEQKHLPIENVRHDPLLSKSFTSMIQSCLVQKGINPKRIYIVVEDDSLGAFPSCPHYILKNGPFSCADRESASCAGWIVVPSGSFLFKDQEVFAKLYAQVIHEKKALFLVALRHCFSDITKLDNNKYYNKCKHLFFPGSIIKLACQSQKDAQDLEALCASHQIGSNDMTSLHLYKKLCKINTHWNFLDWLQNYSSLHTRLIIKKDPTREPVTEQELHVWQRDNKACVCLPVRSNSSDSLNPFDVLYTNSFSKGCMDHRQDVLMYGLFAAALMGLCVYEHQAAPVGFLLKKLDPCEYKINSLVQKYSRKTIRQAIKLANEYAAITGKARIKI